MGEILRLQKYIAMCGVCSRRKAEELILADKVKVNGAKVKELGTKVEIGNDRVEVEGKTIALPNKMYYIMLNKPKGYITSSSDQFGRPTVVDLISFDIHHRVFSVGRLDYETEGLLILTNDGAFAQKVMHPKNGVNKTYVAVVKGSLSIPLLGKLRRGIKVDDYVTSPAEVEVLNSQPGFNTIKITIHEGKNRQVRKMFEAIDLTVVDLKRVSIGNLEIGGLSVGRWRHLTSHEVNYLKNL